MKNDAENDKKGVKSAEFFPWNSYCWREIPTFAPPNLFWQILLFAVGGRVSSGINQIVQPKSKGNEPLRTDGDLYSGSF
jgi:hypothetical protein